jgi:hypothetical protein
VVGPGHHIALSREHAKRVFANKDDASLPPLIAELLGDKSLKANSQILDVKRTWDAIHRCLTEGTLDPEAGEFPLNHVILGGKKLHNGDDYIAVVVRPDMVTFIAEGLREVKEPDFRKAFFALGEKGYDQAINEKEYSFIWHMVQEIRAFFEYCDEERFAVLFTGRYRE